MVFNLSTQTPGQAPQTPAQPVTGQQALYLLALMAQLAQAAHQGQALPQHLAPPQQQVQAHPDGPNQPAQAQTPPQAQPVSGAMPVPAVAGVELPGLPVGTRGNRHYWFGPLPTSSLNRLTRGPIRSAWSL
jgi:hypothetical protein